LQDWNKVKTNSGENMSLCGGDRDSRLSSTARSGVFAEPLSNMSLRGTKAERTRIHDFTRRQGRHRHWRVSGIGRAIALMFAAHGASVVLTARRKTLLDEVADAIRKIGIIDQGGRHARLRGRGHQIIGVVKIGVRTAVASQIAAYVAGEVRTGLTYAMRFRLMDSPCQ
jgi:hypothetical protein